MLQFLVILLGIFVLPVLALYLKLIPSKYKLVVLIVAAFAIPFLMSFLGFNLEKAGIRFDNFANSALPYLVFTCIGAILLIILAKIMKRSVTANFSTNIHFKYLFIPISFAQEFLYHSFLFTYSLLVLDNVLFSILLNSILFALIHIFYPRKLFSTTFAFVAGIGFTTMYYFFPNLILITVSHSILNYIAVMFGFFSNEYKPETRDN